MRPLYPEIKPYNSGHLAVEEPHQLYYEECGNPDGVPVIFIHGGPGMGCDSKSRRFFDPELYRIIIFDQRGAGRSTPHANLENNTTQALVADMEVLRDHLQVKQWMLFGGSWGSTLALAYAETHPENVLAMVLRGIFLCRKRDLDWFYEGGAAHVYPEYWQDYVKPIPKIERNNFISAYYKQLIGDNEIQKMAAAKAWSVWEGRCATLRPNEDVVHHFADPHTALALARIEAHYFVNNSFMEENQLVKNAAAIANIPGIIIHGRYDMVCPLDNAYALHQAWPNAELEIIRDAGHAAFEAGIIDALVRATEKMAHKIRKDFRPGA
ncbi:MAG: prolyl aminopeptidase [Cellvibrionaceae bacterium]